MEKNLWRVSNGEFKEWNSEVNISFTKAQIFSNDGPLRFIIIVFFIRYHLGLLVTINWANKLSTNNMVSVKRDVEDTLSWRESRNSCFSVSSLYCSYTRASCDHFPWCIIWRSWAPMRVSFFCLGSVLE